VSPDVAAELRDRSIVAATAEWVNGLCGWNWIGHFTFRFEASIWSTQKRFPEFISAVAPDLSCFYAVEQNPSRDGHHVHALIGNTRELRRKAIWRAWFERYGRNRIEPIRSADDVAGYCAKYVCKRRAWWDVAIDRATREKLNSVDPGAIGGLFGAESAP
jgi:hypothetical protein